MPSTVTYAPGSASAAGCESQAQPPARVSGALAATVGGYRTHWCAVQGVRAVEAQLVEAAVHGDPEQAFKGPVLQVPGGA